MVLPQHVLRQVTSASSRAEPVQRHLATADWHDILGHAPQASVDLFTRFYGIATPNTAPPPCPFCTAHSQPDAPSWTLPSHFRRSLQRPFQLLRCDLLQPFPGERFSTRNYVLVIQDLYSGYTAVRFLFAPSDTSAAFRSFLRFHSTQRRCRPTHVFSATPKLFYTNDDRIKFLAVPPMHTTDLRQRLRSMHEAAQLPLADWPYTCKHLFYLHNYAPLGTTTPIRLWTGSSHTPPQLHPFGCGVLFQTTSSAPRRGIFLGHTDAGRYVIRDIYTRDIHFLHGAVFEHQRPPINTPAVNAATLTSKLPTSYTSAASSPDAEAWIDAMNTELAMLRELTVWSLVPSPEGKRVIPTKWVFTQKHNPDGTLRKYKARLVVSGNHQSQGIDYYSSFSPVVKQSSVKLLLAIAAKNHYDVSFLDVTNAYCWGTLTDETYCKQPPGFQQTDAHGTPLVCKLHKSLYGLPQSGRCWNLRLTEILITIGLQQSDYDPCVFYKITSSSFFAISIYVDDNMLVTSNNTQKTFFLNRIQSHIKILPVRDQLYLGMKITPVKDGYRLDQSAYVNKLLTRFDMANCNPVRTPLIVSQSGDASPHVQKTPGLATNKPFQELLGCLLYLSNVSRPDITYPTVAMSVHSHSPMQHHMGILKRILRYLRGTPSLGINFLSTNTGQLYAASDASLCSFPHSRSVSGIAIFLGSAPLLWRTKQQSLVALSSCEAEIYAIAETCKDLVPIRGLLLELAPNLVSSPTTLYTDSYSAMYLILNGGSTRTRHFHKRVNFIQDYLKNYDIALKYMPTNTIPADFLTKPFTHVACSDTLKTFYGITSVEN